MSETQHRFWGVRVVQEMIYAQEFVDAYRPALAFWRRRKRLRSLPIWRSFGRRRARA
jgi:hypothetical protein